MTHQSGKRSTLILAVLFLLVTFALTPRLPEKKTSIMAGPPSPARRAVKAGQTSTTVFAVIDRVNAAGKTMTLHSAEGMTIEIEVSEAALAELKRGDRIKVTIDKYISIAIDKVQEVQLSAMDIGL